MHIIYKINIAYVKEQFPISEIGVPLVDYVDDLGVLLQIQQSAVNSE